MSNMRSPLGKARGLGSSNEGVGHWWSQRLSSLALIPLTVWFAFSATGIFSGGYEAYQAWVSVPGNTTLLVLLIIVAFNHAQQGVQVVIEDYVHSECKKVGGIIAVKFACALFGTACILSVLKVAFGG